MIRAASLLLTTIAAAAAIGFTALYLGGYPAFSHERVALVPLIAGLCAAVLEGYRRASLPRLTTAIALILLGVWCVFLCKPF